MADFPAPVANQFKMPDPSQGIGQLSGIIGLQQQQQNLQTGQYQQATAQAESQQAQQKNNEMQKVSALMQGVHGGGYRKADGSLDRQRLADDVSTVAPAYGQPQAASILSQANEIVSNQKAKQDLTDSARTSLGTTLTALAKDPNTRRDDVVSGYTQWLQDHKDDPAAFRVGIAQAALLPQNDADPKYREILGKYAATLTGQPTTAPSTVETAGQIQPGQTSGITGGFSPAGAPIAKPPTQTTNAAGQILNRSPQTGALSPAGAGSSAGPPGAAGPPGGINPTTAQAQTAQGAAKDASEGIENARAIGDQAPGIRNVNSQLLKLSQETATGPGSQTVQHIRAMLGMPSGSNYQEISAYLDRQAAMQARTMGLPNTNAGLAASQSATGTTEYTPKALQEKVKFADALNSGAMAYRQGLDKAVGTAAAPDISKYQAYRSAWTQNFDPDVFRAEDAMRHGDKAELADLKKRLGPEGMKTLAQKSANLRQLENGQIPQ
jgi:hypothetical protein